jgi:hypothetical protein
MLLLPAPVACDATRVLFLQSPYAAMLLLHIHAHDTTTS